jgi:transcriptional/translational regulatory protein YebC/TACO1
LLIYLAGIPKASIESALARGQGKSASGIALEAFTLEAMIPPNVSVIIETETDNKNRTMMDLKHLITNRYKGTATPTAYLFQRRGRIAFDKDEKTTVDDVLDEAIEAGAEDVESDEEGNIVVWTEPNMTMAAATALQKSHGLKVERMDILWDANEDTRVTLDEDAAKIFAAFLKDVRDTSNVEGVYANVTQGDLKDECWEEIEDKLDA